MTVGTLSPSKFNRRRTMAVCANFFMDLDLSMTITVVAVGISGVGKTWLLEKCANILPIQLLTGSSLIIEGRQENIGGSTHADELRKLKTYDNQNILINTFKKKRDSRFRATVLDTHNLLDTPEGEELVKSDIFEAVGTDAIIFIEGSPSTIFERRLNDKSRSRPKRNIEALAKQQCIAKNAARDVASIIDVPFFVVLADDISALCSIILSLFDSSN